jgi:hypothetical protein
MTNYKTITDKMMLKSQGKVFSVFQMSIHLLNNNSLINLLNLNDVTMNEFKLLEAEHISFDVSPDFYLFGLFINNPQTQEITYFTLKELTNLHIFNEDYSIFLYKFIQYSLTKHKIENF